MREEFETMSPEARHALFSDRAKEFESRERRRMDEFFAKPAAEQIAAIDKEIDRDEARRKRWQERQAQGGGQTAEASGRGSGGPGGPGGGRGGPGGGRGGWGGGRGGNSAQRQKSYLDRTSPIDRAQRNEYRRMRNARRAQRAGCPRANQRPRGGPLCVSYQHRRTDAIDPPSGPRYTPAPCRTRPPRLAGVALLDVDS